MSSIDLNSDLGESFGSWQMGDDAAMLEIVTSANIACGFHAGDPVGILKTLKAAVKNNVTVGAHIGYRDLVGFGRRNMDVSDDELVGDVIYQIGALQGLAKAAGTTVRYVKPHGALYNTIATNTRQANAVIEGIKAIDGNLILMALASSPIIQQAKAAGLKTVEEAFADRTYNNDGSLVARSRDGAVLHEPEIVAKRMLDFVTSGTIKTIDGKTIQLQAQSICLHGDNPDAVAMAKAVRTIFKKNGVKLQFFAS